MRRRSENESPIVCDLTAMDAAQRERRARAAERLRAATQEIRELPDGYGFRFPAEAALCLAAAEFITLERLCCPFLRFVIEVEPEGGPLWLRLSGREGVKEFLRVELQISPSHLAE